MIKEELKEMYLHTTKILRGGIEILRVPDGWIYFKTDKIFCAGVGDQITTTATFVPEKD